MLTIADLIELAETIESRANHYRDLAARTRSSAKLREHYAGKADASDADARCVRVLIKVHEPVTRPALRLVTKEDGAHV